MVIVLGGVLGARAVAPSRSKLGIHLLVSYSPGATAINSAHPGVFKILGTDSTMLRAAREYKAATPQGLVVLRFYTILRWSLQDDPGMAASNFWSQVLAPATTSLSPADRKLIDYVEGPNETDSTPAWGSLSEAQWFNSFWVVLGRMIRDNGFRPCAFSIPVGNPGGTDAQVKQMLAAIVPALRICLNAGGGWSYHAYTDQYLQDPGVEYWYSLRYRQYYSYFASSYPDLADLPLLLTEGGVDNGHGWNWPANGDTAKFKSWLAWFDQQIRQDPAVLGVTLFQSGDTSPQWQSWDIEPISGWLSTNLTTQPLTGPMLALSPGMLEVVASEGASPVKAQFTIRNIALGSASYSLTSSATWMSLSPASGVVAAQTNLATITCNLGSLVVGTYYGIIKVRCALASPALQTVSVRLRILPRLSINRGGSQPSLLWTGAVGALEKAPSLNGPWQRILNPTSPYPVTPTAAQSFFRVGP